MQQSIQTILRTHLPLILVSIIGLFCIVYYHTQIVQVNNGMFVYTIDDPYIHASIARNVAQHGVWGISPDAVSSASSSPLWVLLLSGIYLFAESPLISYAVNILLAFILLFVVHRYFLQHEVNAIPRTIGLVVLWFATPIHGLLFTGMEHILHIILTLLLLFKAVEILSNQNLTPKNILQLAILCFVNSAIRPEGVLLSMIITGCILLRGKWYQAVTLFVCSAAPIILFGVWSILHGELFLPNSIVVKSLDAMQSQQHISGLRAVFPRLGLALTLLRRYEELLWCLQISTVIFGIFFWKNIRNNNAASPLNFLFQDKTTLTFGLISTAVLAHILTSDAGWFFRYEAYLIAMCIVASYTVLTRIIANINVTKYMYVLYSLATVILLITCFPLLSRSLQSARQLVAFTSMQYQKQIQTARFLSTYYSNKPVGVTDIGAVSYFTTARLTDFYGLGSSVVARYKLNHEWNANKVQQLATQQQWQCAFTYADEQQEFIPSTWIPVATFTVASNHFTNQSTLTFYAPSKQYQEQLRANLSAFSATLPKEVTLILLPTSQ